MKKSEFRKILSDSIYKHMNMLCCNNEFEMLDHILEDIVRAGMLPVSIDESGNLTSLDWTKEDE